MPNTPLQGKLILLEMSDDNWTTSYTLTCLISQGFQGSRSVSTKSTQCGTSVGLGPADNKIPWEADLNTTPDAVAAGVGQVSLVKLMTWYDAGTLLRVRQKYPTDGSVFYRESAAYLTEYNETDPTDNVVTATGSFQLTGALDMTPP